MAGMFYSIQEAAKKLGMTEEQVKALVSSGRLREFRDGSNVLFKIDEVEALMSDTSIKGKSAPEAAEDEEEEIALKTEDEKKPVAGKDLLSADTAITKEGLNVLGETDSGYKLADDTKAETKSGSGAGEASLEAIEEDVSLDTFGSGSGLLDLSLQADDTSLGGILDEIYTGEGGESPGGEAAAKKTAGEKGQAAEGVAAGTGSGPAFSGLPEEALAEPQPTQMAPLMAQAYAAEPETDFQSNMFGVALFVPLMVIIYTAIVAVAGFNNVTPAIMMKVQAIIWYVLVGLAALAIVLVGSGFVLGGGRGEKTAAKPKAKKEKKVKSKKDAETPPAAEPESSE